MAWRNYKENPHIQYNSATREYRCSTCNIKLNTNPGGAGKHSTKIHGLMLSGKKIEKKKSVLVPEISTKDIYDGVEDLSSSLDENFEKILSYLEVLDAKNEKLERQNYLLLEKIHNIGLEQEILLKRFDKLKKENSDVIEFIRTYVFIKAAQQSQ